MRQRSLLLSLVQALRQWYSCKATGGNDDGAHLLGQAPVALCHRGCRFWKLNILKEGNDVLLPENAMELLLEIDKGVGSLRVPDIGLPCLHAQPQVVADDLWSAAHRCGKVAEHKGSYRDSCLGGDRPQQHIRCAGAQRQPGDSIEAAAVVSRPMRTAYLGAPACPHIIVAAQGLPVSHQAKVHGRPN